MMQSNYNATTGWLSCTVVYCVVLSQIDDDDHGHSPLFVVLSSMTMFVCSPVTHGHVKMMMKKPAIHVLLR